MKDSELLDMWQNVEHNQQRKSKDELAIIVDTKAQKTVNKFLLVSAISGMTSVAVIIFVVITALNRREDTLFVINNVLLGLITIVALISAFVSWHNLNNRNYSKSVKDWLEKNIKLISKSLYGRYKRLYILIIPIVYTLIVMSINVYFSNKRFIEVFSSKESVVALVVGAIVGLSVSFYIERKIRNYHLRNLKNLEELYKNISEID